MRQERTVAFTDVFNFRDLGGYQTTDGRTTRWDRLFRADDLSRLGPADREQFTALGIRTVIDLRRPNEIATDGRIPPFHEFDYHHIHLTHPAWPSRSFVDTTERIGYVIDRYREMSQNSAAGFAQALSLIAEPDRSPLVFHCIAGKDRTGILAALTLSLLGVPEDVIVSDYYLSEKAEPASWDQYTRHRRPDLRGTVRPYLISPPEAMAGFLADLRARFGSVTAYTESIGVTAAQVESMRSHLLES